MFGRAPALALSLLVALAGCAGQTTGAPSESAGSSVTLVTYDSYAISKKTLRRFTEETGIEVEVVRGGDGAEVVNRALLTKENPEGDVLFGVDNNLLSRAESNGLFQPYAATGADSIPEEYRAQGGASVTPIDVGDVCVNYDADWFRERDLPVPESLDDLTQPRYRDLLVVENPGTSTPGLAFMLATVAQYGEDGYADYWRRLVDNGVQVENSWDSAYYERFSGGSGEGDRPLVVSYASSPAAEVVFAEKPVKKGEEPTGAITGTCYRQIEFAGVLVNAANPSGARKLVDFMITREYQEDLPLNNFVFPVLPDAQLPAAFADNAELTETPLSVPAEQVDNRRDAWVQTWTDTVQR